LGVTEGTIQWSLYEQFKKMARVNSGLQEGEEQTGWRVSAAAGAAKLVATVITYPHEVRVLPPPSLPLCLVYSSSPSEQVIRTRLRQPPPASGIPKYTSLVQSFRLVLLEEGWKALYGGMSPHLLRVVPNAVTMFFVYEKALGMAEKRANKTIDEETGRVV
jgi:solute carrier family 25 protein 33/36